jgi:hypothetical protein
MVGQNTSNKRSQGNDAGQPTVYHIRIQGHLGLKWTEWFDGMTISLEENGDTLIAGPVVDQAALHGLLRKVRDLNMPLISIVIQTDPPAESPLYLDIPDLDAGETHMK